MTLLRADAAVLLALALYFIAHAALRSLLGGALEVDEAEMLILAQDWHAGYGPQLPLYNWLQVAAFALLGEGTVALAVLKNAVLWAAYAALYLGLRQVVAVPQAVAGMLALALLPNVVWEFQRASTHSIALLATVTATVAAVLALMQRGGWRDYALFGLVLGLGGLAKANYWVVPVVLLLAAWRMAGPPRRLRAGGMILSGAIAAAMVAWPYRWMLDHPGLAGASAHKMYRADTGLPAGVEGVVETLGGLVAGLVLVAVAAGVLWRSGRGRSGRGRAPTGPEWPGLLLLRAGGLALLVSLGAVLWGGISQVQSRWLVPVMVLLACGAMLLAARRASGGALRGLTVAGVCAGVITLAGMAELRLSGPSTGGLDFAPLAALTDRLDPDLVLADYHLGGNLRLLRPGTVVVPPLALPQVAGVRRVLVLGRGEGAPDVAQAFRQRGLAVPDGVVQDGVVPDGTMPDGTMPDGAMPDGAAAGVSEGTVALGYTNAAGARLMIRYLLLPEVRVGPALP